MNNIVKTMLMKYKCKNIEDKINALRESLQEIILACLGKTKFFSKAAFFGGTALRIYYGLDRYSEDLDFSLIKPDLDFNFEIYKNQLVELLKSFNLFFKIEHKNKSIKTDRITYFAKIKIKDLIKEYFNTETKQIDDKQLLSIKIEIDVNPPIGANISHKYRLMPFPYEVVLYDIPTLFSTKINAVLSRRYITRTKGRDLYDLLFYIKNGYTFNLNHLQYRLKRENIASESNMSYMDVIKLLNNKMESIDWAEAKNDIKPLLNSKSSEELEIWSTDFFKDAIKLIKKSCDD